MFMYKEGMTLASEILKEVKASARRWFIAFLIMCVVELATVGGFLWYISLPVDEGVMVENEDGNALYVGNNNDVSGGVFNGADSGLQSETESQW